MASLEERKRKLEARAEKMRNFRTHTWVKVVPTQYPEYTLYHQYHMCSECGVRNVGNTDARDYPCLPTVSVLDEDSDYTSS
jgi:hypothetical protein